LPATAASPGRMIWPSSASLTRSGLLLSSQRTRPSVKPSAMCCTTAIGTGKSAGSAPRMLCRAIGPPALAPMAITSGGAARGSVSSGVGSGRVFQRRTTLTAAIARSVPRNWSRAAG